MTIRLINRDTEAELLLEGRLDSNTSEKADEAFQSIVGRFNKIILNFNDLSYLSSAGLRVLKRMYMACRQNDVDLVLTHVNRLIMEVFEMTGFAGILHIEEE